MSAISLTIWNETNFLRYLLNSFIVTGSSILLILVLGTMAAYAIARYQFFGASFILLFFLAGLTLPLKLAIIPLFILMRDIGHPQQPAVADRASMWRWACRRRCSS